jgi:tetratricopeptide (TPR) repeat protein
MKPASELHVLIHSLTPNEKGYFKKFCLRNGPNSGKKYLNLFDALAAMKSYDEEKLRQKLSGNSSHLASEKNYLFHLIIESLLTSRTDADALFECELLVSKARLLSNRSFFEAAARFCERALQKAKVNEYYTYALEALDIEMLLWQYLPHDNRRSLEEIIEERKAVRRDMNITDDLRLIDMSVVRLFQEIGIGRNDEHLAQYRKLYEEARAVKTANENLPLRAQIYFYNIGVFYYNVISNAEGSLNDLRAMIALFDTNPVIRKERLSFYISSLNNIILLLMHMGQFEEAQKRIDQLSAIETDTQNHRNTLFITRYNTQFDLYTLSKQWDKLLVLSMKMKEEIREYENRLDNRYTGHVRFAAFRSCFYNGQYKEALQWINQMVQKPKGEPFKPEVVAVARIAEIVLHETMGNYDLAETLLDSAKRFASKNNSYYPFEKVMFDFFTRRFNHPEDNGLFAALKSDLDRISEDPLQRRVMLYFNFSEWAKSRTENVLIRDLI